MSVASAAPQNRWQNRRRYLGKFDLEATEIVEVKLVSWFQALWDGIVHGAAHSNTNQFPIKYQRRPEALIQTDFGTNKHCAAAYEIAAERRLVLYFNVAICSQMRSRHNLTIETSVHGSRVHMLKIFLWKLMMLSNRCKCLPERARQMHSIQTDSSTQPIFNFQEPGSGAAICLRKANTIHPAIT